MYIYGEKKKSVLMVTEKKGFYKNIYFLCYFVWGFLRKTRDYLEVIEIYI